MNERMLDELMNDWMMNEWLLSQWMNEWMNEWWMEWLMSSWMNEWMKWMNGWMDAFCVHALAAPFADWPDHGLWHHLHLLVSGNVLRRRVRVKDDLGARELPQLKRETARSVHQAETRIPNALSHGPHTFIADSEDYRKQFRLLNGIRMEYNFEWNSRSVGTFSKLTSSISTPLTD